MQPQKGPFGCWVGTKPREPGLSHQIWPKREKTRPNSHCQALPHSQPKNKLGKFLQSSCKFVQVRAPGRNIARNHKFFRANFGFCFWATFFVQSSCKVRASSCKLVQTHANSCKFTRMLFGGRWGKANVFFRQWGRIWVIYEELGRFFLRQPLPGLLGAVWGELPTVQQQVGWKTDSQHGYGPSSREGRPFNTTFLVSDRKAHMAWFCFVWPLCPPRLPVSYERHGFCTSTDRSF